MRGACIGSFLVFSARKDYSNALHATPQTVRSSAISMRAHTQGQHSSPALEPHAFTQQKCSYSGDRADAQKFCRMRAPRSRPAAPPLDGGLLLGQPRPACWASASSHHTAHCHSRGTWGRFSQAVCSCASVCSTSSTPPCKNLGHGAGRAESGRPLSRRPWWACLPGSQPASQLCPQQISLGSSAGAFARLASAHHDARG